MSSARFVGLTTSTARSGAIARRLLGPTRCHPNFADPFERNKGQIWSALKLTLAPGPKRSSNRCPSRTLYQPTLGSCQVGRQPKRMRSWTRFLHAMTVIELVQALAFRSAIAARFVCDRSRRVQQCRGSHALPRSIEFRLPGIIIDCFELRQFRFRARNNPASNLRRRVARNSHSQRGHSLSPASLRAVCLKPPSSFAPFLIANRLDLLEMNSVLLATTGVE